MSLCVSFPPQASSFESSALRAEQTRTVFTERKVAGVTEVKIRREKRRRDTSCLLFFFESDPNIKLAADETKGLEEEGEAARGRGSPADKESHGKLVRVELEWDIPMAVTLPVQVQPDPAHQPFPFLDTTLADLGIEESEVKERVVWVDTKKTQVKNKAGKLKEKEITILEVRVKAQKPGEKELQEVLYTTEAHTDRSFCRTGMDILPWKQRYTGENGATAVQMTMALDNEQPDSTEADGQRDI